MDILFRPHRGGFNNSMKLAKVVTSIEDVLHDLGLTNVKAHCEYYAYDERSGWDTYSIVVGNTIVGFTNAFVE